MSKFKDALKKIESCTLESNHAVNDYEDRIILDLKEIADAVDNATCSEPRYDPNLTTWFCPKCDRVLFDYQRVDGVKYCSFCGKKVSE